METGTCICQAGTIQNGSPVKSSTTTVLTALCLCLRRDGLVFRSQLSLLPQVPSIYSPYVVVTAGEMENGDLLGL